MLMSGCNADDRYLGVELTRVQRVCTKETPQKYVQHFLRFH